MREIQWCISNSYQGSIEETIQVPDDATDDEIDALVEAEVLEIINWGWEEIGGVGNGRQIFIQGEAR